MHKNYDRTFYYFNFCILVSQKEYESNYYLYELLIKKIGDMCVVCFWIFLATMPLLQHLLIINGLGGADWVQK